MLPYPRFLDVLMDDRTPARRTGDDGEIAATGYLRARGYKILGRNVRLVKDEIDIIAYDPFDGCVVFAEVKSRARAVSDYSPAMRLNGRKKAAMSRAAQKWIDKKNYHGGYRLDAILVADGRVMDHYKQVSSD